MPAPIEFYFDFSSPYGYVGANTIDVIAKKHGREVNWHPILLGAVFQITGGTAPVNIPLKSDYFRHDFERTTRLFKVDYQFPSIFPITGLVPARAFYWINNQNPALAKQFALAAYRAYFVDDRDIQKGEVILDVAAALGINRDDLTAALGDTAVKDKLKAEVQSAIDKGVFGSPYFIVDNEPFFGSDRIVQVEQWLAKGGW